jgi:peroxiredoxin
MPSPETIMKPRLSSALVAAAPFAFLAAPAGAALKAGDAAPDFTTEAAIGGKEFRFALADALKKGPVVLYFFPKSFTKGCTAEAHLFAEATAKFNALGATVVGISTDDIETQKRFSTEECRNKFAVASDQDAVITKQYDAKMATMPVSDRISYVIAPEGRIVYTYASMDPQDHVANTMKAVEDWKAAHPR